MERTTELFSLAGKTAVVTGGAGVLGSRIAEGLGQAGATVVVGDIRKHDETAASLQKKGVKARGLLMDMMDKKKIQEACALVLGELGSIDILVNAAGGNVKEATTSPEVPFFDLPKDALE